MKKVSIITVNYNQPDVTELMLDSIFSTNTYFALEIIVVDNGSKNSRVSEWKKKYPPVNFIESKNNLGFAGGNNLGIKEATGDYLFFVNNDTEFTEDLLDKLAATLDTHPEVGIVSPKIRYFAHPTIIQYVGFTPMNYYTARNKCIGQFEEDKGQYDGSSGETGFAHGAAMMVRRETIDQAGMMPDIYFLYYEEMDWCMQIKNAGYKIWVNTDALIYHKESISVGAQSALKEYFMNRNRILFIRRNAPTKIAVIFWGYFLLVVAPRNTINYIKKRQWKFIFILFRAVFWNAIHTTHSTNLGYTIKD